MVSPTQTTAAVKADNVGPNPSVNAGLTFQAGRDVVIQFGHFQSGTDYISAISIGGTSGIPIAVQTSALGTVRAESWLFKNLGSNDSTVDFTAANSGHYITLVGREFPAGTFGDVDSAAAGVAEASAQSMPISTATSIAQASSALFATMVANTSGNPFGFIGISGYSDVVTQQDNDNSQAILVGWLEETTTGTKTATGSQTNNSPWIGSLGVVKLAGDTTAPTLTSQTGSATSSTTASIGATTDEANGTMYAVVDTVTTTPSAAELEAGQDGDGGAAIWSGSQAITTTGAKSFNVTGLTPNTAYSYFIGHKDAAGNFSNIVGGTFTTDQRAMPSADVVDGAWTPSTGADLYAVLDENPASDADYIQTNTAADSCTVALASVTDPASSAGHKVSYRLQGDGTSGVLVELLQGSTVIASWTHDPAPSSVTQFDQTLTGTQADSITDYTALRVRFTEV